MAVAWFTRGGGGPKVLCMTSSDGGETFGKPVKVSGKEPIGRCGVAVLADGAVATCWLELVDNVAEVRVSRNGAQAVVVARTAASRSAGVPEIVAEGKNVVVAWRDVSKRRVLTARVTW